ncbi:phage tail protein [Selenomonas sp. oral taxon 920]|uniref:phage tail protein n=1 Tax=Selenomonas sp. oral taxon 920 TaxID=1884263 RepID=UPI00131B27F0|nr:phage tail protein [Selenomonas sp. oral taxon 920]
MRGSLYLPAGYVKCNGATVQRADYPRLVALADKHDLWTDDVTANAGLFGRGDGAVTMVLPNWTDRMVQFAGDGAGASIAAGLPNITGAFVARYHDLNEWAGCFDHEGRNYVPYYVTEKSSQIHKTIFDASRSSPVYGASETVQPAAIKLMPIIRY